ncbi:hypothetical protein QNI16_32120 [Cytophagaceae bacterium YF14B1]|uniref:Histidine kinase n=1 Tax=Xanthocytophaga flava TaxID=3048013 RepID=A0AAE3QTK3_9BACT|nr:hypothetical protein [Xanthocytophaga flavus]MDJ1485190.1 hypothetical protein [Xanthocytophaga flavus]
MSNPLEFRYRLVYESLAKLTTHLNHSETLDEVQHCLQRHLKYLFDSQLVRFGYYQDGQYIIYSVFKAESRLETGSTKIFWEHEHILQKQEIPVVLDNLSNLDVRAETYPIPLKEVCDKIWGWHFPFGTASGMVVSVFSGENKLFSQTDIPVLKIVSESLYSRIFTICLIQELDQRKQDLLIALEDVQEKNRIVSDLVHKQEEIIQQRTHELQRKNEKLLELSKLNAHSVREPLSRILGLIQVAELIYSNEIQPEWLAMLQVSSQDLDSALQNVIQLTDREILK